MVTIMKQACKLTKILLCLTALLMLLLCAAACNLTEGDFTEPSENAHASVADETETTAVSLSDMKPDELYDHAREVTGLSPYSQTTITGSLEVTNRSGDVETRPFSLVLSRDGSMSHIHMTSPDGLVREMTYSDGYLYWREDGDQLRIRLNETRIPGMIGALDYSLRIIPGGVDMEKYTHYVTEFPAIATLFSTVEAQEKREAADGEAAYSLRICDPIPGESGSFFYDTALETMTLTASVMKDGRFSDMTIDGVWSNAGTEGGLSFYIMPILADTMGLKEGREGAYCRMAWSFDISFAYKDVKIDPPEPTAEDIHLTWDEVVGIHHVIPTAEIYIMGGTNKRNVLFSSDTSCVVVYQAKEGRHLARRGRMLYWQIYRLEDGRETLIASYRGRNYLTAVLEDDIWVNQPYGDSSGFYLPLKAGEYKMVAKYIGIDATGRTYEEDWDIAGVTLFTVRDKKSQE